MPVVNSSYTVIVNNGKVIQIADNSIDFEMRNINTDFNMNDATIAKEAATSDTVRQNIYTCIDNFTNIAPITIRQQDLRKFIDLNTGKKFIQVFTTYGYSGSTAIAGTQYDYEVE